MSDLIDREVAIEAVKTALLSWSSMPQWRDDKIIDVLAELPSTHPELNEWCHDCKEYDTEKGCCPRWGQVIRTALEDAKPEQRWVSCSERLPEEYGEYLITWETSKAPRRFIGFAEGEETGEWDDKHDRFAFRWLPDDYIIKNYPDWRVIAWMPLPDPWKGES